MVDKAPVDYVLGTATVAAVVEGKTTTMETDIPVMLLSEKWVTIPVGASGGVIGVTVDGEAAMLVQRRADDLCLLNGKGKTKAVVHVSAEKKAVAEGPVTKLDLWLPPSPVVGVTVSVKEVNLELKAVNGAGTKVAESGGKTVLTASFQGDQTGSVTWKNKAAAGTEVPAAAVANTATLVAVGRGVLHYRADIRYEISCGRR